MSARNNPPVIVKKKLATPCAHAKAPRFDEGDELTWQIKVTNSDGPERDFVVCDDVPVGVEDFTWESDAGTSGEGAMEDTVTIAPGACVTYLVKAVVAPVGCEAKTTANSVRVKDAANPCEDFQATSDVVILGEGDPAYCPTDGRFSNDQSALVALLLGDDEALTTKMFNLLNCGFNLVDFICNNLTDEIGDDTFSTIEQTTSYTSTITFPDGQTKEVVCGPVGVGYDLTCTLTEPQIVSAPDDAPEGSPAFTIVLPCPPDPCPAWTPGSDDPTDPLFCEPATPTAPNLVNLPHEVRRPDGAVFKWDPETGEYTKVACGSPVVQQPVDEEGRVGFGTVSPEIVDMGGTGTADPGAVQIPITGPIGETVWSDPHKITYENKCMDPVSQQIESTMLGYHSIIGATQPIEIKHSFQLELFPGFWVDLFQDVPAVVNPNAESNGVSVGFVRNNFHWVLPFQNVATIPKLETACIVLRTGIQICDPLGVMEAGLVGQVGTGFRWSGSMIQNCDVKVLA